MNEQEILIKLNDHDHQIGNLKHRVGCCETEQKEFGKLIRSVDKLANNMEHMLKELQDQGKRLEKLEQAPADDYKYYKRLVVGCIMTGIVGAILGAVIALVIK